MSENKSFFIILCFSLCIIPCAGAETVDIITFSYPPYMNEEGQGILSEIIQASTKNTDISVSYKIYPRKRAVHIFNQAETKELFLGERGYFSDIENFEILTLMEFKTVFVYVKAKYPSIKYRNAKDLAGKRIGVSFGSALIPFFKSNGLIVEEAYLENNLQRLKTERIDFWHTVDTAAIDIIRKRYPGQIKEFGFLMDKKLTADLIVKKESPSISAFQVISKQFTTLEKQGEIKKLIKSYQAEANQ